METDQVYRSGNSSEKDKDKDGGKKKDSRGPVFVPLKIEANEKPVEQKSFTESLQALFKDKEAEDNKDEAKLEKKEAHTDDEAGQQAVARVEQPTNRTDETSTDFEVIPLENVNGHEHVIELNPAASTLHERLQPGRTEEAVVEDSTDLERVKAEDSPPEQPEVDTPAASETEPEAKEKPLVAEVASGSGGEEPPRGPERLAELTPEEPEPDRTPPILADALTMPSWEQPEHLQEATAVNSQLSPETPPTSSETQVVYQEGDGGGGLLLLAAWEAWRHHRMNKRARRVEAKQNKRLRNIELAQATTRDQQYRSSIEQAQQNYQLHEALAAETTRREQLARNFKTERRPNPAERAPVPAEESHAEQQPDLPTGHHIERSAWHSIEVDKSGRVVEAPVFSYGEEFKREQHQEARRQDELVAAELVGYSAVNQILSSSSAQGSALSGGAPTNGRARTALPLPEIRNAVSDPVNIVLWVVLVVIVFAIVATLILR